MPDASFHPSLGARGRDMPVITINGQQFALQPGPNRLGDSTADVMIDPAGAGVQAIVELGADGRAIIHKAGAQGIRVNGTDLSQPMPLIHGDKVEIGGKELFFADDAKVGSTQFVSAANVAGAAAKRTGAARGTLGTGGRLVSLVDGKEYAVPEAGITIGRDASADIVVAQTSVSRRHAQVIPSATGYVINDLSTNGVLVNGEKVNSGHALSRADVITVGTEEFRFYADLAPMAKAASPAPAGARPSAPSAPPTPAIPAAPAAAAPSARPDLDVTRPLRPLTPPPAHVPAPQAPAAAVQASKSPTPPERPATPRPTPRPPTPKEAPVTTKGGVPGWAAWLVLIAVAGVAAYFIYMSQK